MYYNSLIKLTFLMLCCFSVVELKAQNLPPVAVTDSYNARMNITLDVDATNGLLSNDTDPNGTAGLIINPSLVSGPSTGTVTLSNDGSFVYIPITAYVGSVTFDYQVCDDGAPNTLVSQFDFDTTPLTMATAGPDATSINTNAVQTACGIRIPGGSTGGSAGLDLIVPNTAGIFDFTSFVVEIDYADREGTADIVEGGNFRIYHISADNIGVRINVINAVTGLSTSYTRNLGGFLSGNKTYIIEYDEITGDIIYTANGTITVFPNVAPDFSPLDASLAGNVTIGKFMDNSGVSSPSLCRIAITDTSKLCSTGSVFLDISVSVITNRKITYRVDTP